MNGTQLNDKIQGGYKRAAPKIGTSFDIYRAPGLTDPLTAANKIATVNAAFGINPAFTAPPKESTRYWYVVTDEPAPQVGDYLASGSTRWVVVSEIPLLPMEVLFVPNTISIYRPNGPHGFGAVSYSDLTQETVVVANVPAYITVKKEVARQPAKLPGDISRRTYWQIAFFLPEGTVQDRDVVVDENGERYQVTANNRSVLGYDCLCERLQA